MIQAVESVCVLLNSMEMCVLCIALESARMEVLYYQSPALAHVQSTSLERTVRHALESARMEAPS